MKHFILTLTGIRISCPLHCQRPSTRLSTQNNPTCRSSVIFTLYTPPRFSSTPVLAWTYDNKDIEHRQHNSFLLKSPQSFQSLSSQNGHFAGPNSSPTKSSMLVQLPHVGQHISPVSWFSVARSRIDTVPDTRYGRRQSRFLKTFLSTPNLFI